MVYAPFAFAVARLTRPLAWRSLICPPGSAGGQAGSPALQSVSPLACPAKRGNCLQNSRARGSAAFGVFACLRSAILSAVLSFGFASRQKPAHPAIVTLFPYPPETRVIAFNALLLTFLLRYAMSYYSLRLCLRQPADSKGCLVDLLPDFVGSQNYPPLTFLI